MMKKIYIVYGCTGVYEDRCEWDVFGFNDENTAKAYQKNLQDLANEIKNHETMFDIDWVHNNHAKMLLELDNHASCMDYNGTTYHIKELWIKE